jgi:drug/metabolite transporter (DMT)-like permease
MVAGQIPHLAEHCFAGVGARAPAALGNMRRKAAGGMEIIMQEKISGSAWGYLLITFFLWGSVYVVGKMVAGDMPAALVAALRCVVAVFPLGFMARKCRGIRISREDLPYFAGVGLLGYFGTIFLIQTAISLTGASTASLVNSASPVSVTVFAALLLGEKITPKTILCLALAIAGTVIVTFGAGGQAEVGGIVIAAISVATWGVASVFMRKLTAKYPAIMVTTVGMLFSLVCHIPVGLIAAVRHASEIHVGLGTIAAVIYLGVVGSGIAQFTWTRTLSMLPASTCSLFYPLQAIFSALLGYFILNEKLTPFFFIGLILISLDILLSQLDLSAFRKERKCT